MKTIAEQLQAENGGEVAGSALLGNAVRVQLQALRAVMGVDERPSFGIERPFERIVSPSSGMKPEIPGVLVRSTDRRRR